MGIREFLGVVSGKRKYMGDLGIYPELKRENRGGKLSIALSDLLKGGI
jgi:hypothetical protein